MITFVRTASIAPGKVGEAIGFAHQSAEFLKAKYGVETGVSMPIGGNPFRIAWVSMHASLAAFEERSSKMMSDPEYLALVATAAGIFLPGSAHDELWRGI